MFSNNSVTTLSITDVDVLKLKSVVSLTDVNLEDNPLPEPLHAQLSEIELFPVSLSPLKLQETSTFDSLDAVD